VTASTHHLAITGGASGIGLATAARWLRDPNRRVVLLDLRPDALEQAVAELGDPARGLVTDVTSRESVDAAFTDIAAAEGTLHGLVNCAGVSRPVATADMTDADWDFLIEVHLGGTMRASRAAYPLLRESNGAIVNLTSVASRVGMPQRASYNTVKHGIDGFTKSIAIEWARDGIRANSVGPGYVDTPFNRRIEAEGKLNFDLVRERIPMRRLADPAEIAGPIVWLLGDEAGYITGHNLMVDAGMTVAGEWYPEVDA
jgi:NAD(P)-dependent dehydrogenase (short-subunit alcohol dehydrogenase family)